MPPVWQLETPAGEERIRPLTKSASGRSRTSVAKAASISRLVLASRTWICSPMARAAAATSARCHLGIAALAGLTSRPHEQQRAPAHAAVPAALAANSTQKKLIPVRLPPGRRRLATRPSLTGSSATTKTMGIVVVAALAANAEGSRRSRITATCRRTNSAASAGSRSILILGPAVFESPRSRPRHSRSLSGPGETRRRRSRSGRVMRREKPDHRHRRLLRTRGERPRSRRAAEQRDELAPSN